VIVESIKGYATHDHVKVDCVVSSTTILVQRIDEIPWCTAKEVGNR
jgi:hypothetical protein